MAHLLALSAAYLLIFSGLFLHELGHWSFMARFGVPLDEYGLGFGPRLLQRGRFCLRPLLLGAYVRPRAEHYLALSVIRQRAIILGGPAANALFAAVLFVAGAWSAAAVRPGLYALADINLFLALSNLIPFPGLDGWHLLKTFTASRLIPDDT